MPRGRRVNSNGERSKQLLLEKAIELFSTHGYYQTKISDIVKTANLTQPTFYLYFESKDSLFKDLNTQFQSRLYSIFEDRYEENSLHIKSGREKMADKLENIFYYFLENPKLTKIGFYFSDEAFEVKNELAQHFIHILNQERAHYPLFETLETELLAESIVGSIERLTLTFLLTKKATPEQLAENIISIYFVEEKELVG